MDFENVKRYTNWKAQWERPEKMSPLNYISFEVHPEDVLILSRLIHPNFVKENDLILLKDNFSIDSLNQWRSENLTNEQIEKTINHIHIYDVFANCNDDVSDNVYLELALFLQSTWQLYLNYSFPDTKIVVELSNEDADYGPILTVYQLNI